MGNDAEVRITQREDGALIIWLYPEELILATEGWCDRAEEAGALLAKGMGIPCRSLYQSGWRTMCTKGRAPRRFIVDAMLDECRGSEQAYKRQGYDRTPPTLPVDVGPWWQDDLDSYRDFHSQPMRRMPGSFGAGARR